MIRKKSITLEWWWWRIRRAMMTRVMRVVLDEDTIAMVRGGCTIDGRGGGGGNGGSVGRGTKISWNRMSITCLPNERKKTPKAKNTNEAND